MPVDMLEQHLLRVLADPSVLFGSVPAFDLAHTAIGLGELSCL